MDYTDATTITKLPIGTIENSTIAKLETKTDYIGTTTVPNYLHNSNTFSYKNTLDGSIVLTVDDLEEIKNVIKRTDNTEVQIEKLKGEINDLNNLIMNLDSVTYNTMVTALDIKADKWDCTSKSDFDHLANSVADFGAALISFNGDVTTNKSTIETLMTKVMELEERIKEKEEKKKGKYNFMKMFNVDFGPVNTDKVRMSPLGLAIRNAKGTWVSYDKTKNDVVDVEAFNFDGSKFLYMVPVAINDIKPNDVVIHNGKPCFVVANYKHSIEVNDIYDGELKKIKPTKNMFGFDYMTKIISLLDFGTPTNDNPFGNMWMFLLADEDNDINPLMFMMMNQQGQDFMNNPMMMALLMDEDKDKNDMFKTMLMMNMMQQSTEAKKSNICGDCNNINYGPATIMSYKEGM